MQYLNIYPLFPAYKKFSPAYSPLCNKPTVDLMCGQCFTISGEACTYLVLDFTVYWSAEIFNNDDDADF